jgi:hypothetical protein
MTPSSHTANTSSPTLSSWLALRSDSPSRRRSVSRRRNVWMLKRKIDDSVPSQSRPACTRKHSIRFGSRCSCSSAPARAPRLEQHVGRAARPQVVRRVGGAQVLDDDEVGDFLRVRAPAGAQRAARGVELQHVAVRRRRPHRVAVGAHQRDRRRVRVEVAPRQRFGWRARGAVHHNQRAVGQREPDGVADHDGAKHRCLPDRRQRDGVRHRAGAAWRHQLVGAHRRALRDRLGRRLEARNRLANARHRLRADAEFRLVERRSRRRRRRQRGGRRRHHAARHSAHVDVGEHGAHLAHQHRHILQSLRGGARARRRRRPNETATAAATRSGRRRWRFGIRSVG